ncbi:MAG: glutathione S-transferase family protein [Burkholderiaceae bacterium]
MIKIWGRENSVNVKKALWCSQELGLAYEHVNAGGSFGVVDTPEYRAMNPNGLVPCIQDDGFILWESNAIVRYLCAKYGAGTLFPADVQKQAIASQWMDWTTSIFTPPYRDIMRNLIRLPAEQRNMSVVEESARDGNHHLAILDAALAKKPFLSGEAFGMGDIPMGCLVYGWLKMPIQHPQLVHVDAWCNRLAQRPAYQDKVMLPLT